MDPFADYIAKNYSGNIVEIGIGGNTEVAQELSKTEGIELQAVDKEDLGYTDFEFIIDDVTEPEMKIYQGADLLYSVRPPVEIIEDLLQLANAVNSDLLVVPLHDDVPTQSYELINYRGTVIYKF